MPQHKSPAKRMKTSERQRLQNKSYKSKYKNLIKKINGALEEGKIEDAKVMYPKISSAVDRAAKVGAIHKNKASRTKSRISKRIKRASAEA